MKEERAKPSHRRKFLGAATLGATAGIVFPKVWTKPVIESVILPAHATSNHPPAKPGAFYCEPLKAVVTEPLVAP